VTPLEALTLINNAPVEDRALWATSFYAGLRRGELQALTWDGVDLAGGLIRVERSWDQKQGPVEPKSAAGFRRTPIPAVLRDYLVQHRVTQDKDKGALVFGRTAGTPFSPSSVAQRAERAWRARGLEPVTLHECRHTFATLMIAAVSTRRRSRRSWATRRSRSPSTATDTCSPALKSGRRACSTPT
jgi:integrase